MNEGRLEVFQWGRCMSRSLTVDEICQLLLALLSSGYPTIDKVAGLLHSSPRSLQRQLGKEGVTYAELVSRCRFREAQRLLTESEDAVQEIAARLGYADPSSFGRAFVRWAGTSPRQYRRQQLGFHDD